MMWPMPARWRCRSISLGLGLVATPLQWAGVNPLAAYNVCLLLTYALSGFFAYLLGRRLTGSRSPASAPGSRSRFAPYRAGQTRAPPGAHVAVDAARAARPARVPVHGRRSGGWWCSAPRGCSRRCRTATSCCSCRCSIVAWLAWFVDWRRAPGRGWRSVRRGPSRRCRSCRCCSSTARSTSVSGWFAKVAEIREFSAIPASFTARRTAAEVLARGPGAELRAVSLPRGDRRPARCRRPLPSAGASTRGRRRRRPRAHRLLCRRRGRDVGPAPRPGRRRTDPAVSLSAYSWLLWLPGFDGLRVPARFAMLGTLCRRDVGGPRGGYLSNSCVRWLWDRPLRRLRAQRTLRWRALAVAASSPASSSTA